MISRNQTIKTRNKLNADNPLKIKGKPDLNQTKTTHIKEKEETLRLKGHQLLLTKWDNCQEIETL